MGFIERELERVTGRLQAGPLPQQEYGELYAVQQALLWSLEPGGFKRPYDMIAATTDIQAAPTDCPAG
ncbi:MAG: hypothetical protein ACREO5_14390, partial [Candidatus Binatia bacterium]